jgi:hypothetical protein
MAEVIDLDIFRPEQKIIRLNGRDIDVSCIPCGITFDIEDLSEQMRKIPAKKIQEGKEDCRKAFDLSIQMCSIFCSRKYPDMTVDWFRDNVNTIQINAFVNEIKDALVKSYKGISEYGKK